MLTDLAGFAAGIVIHLLGPHWYRSPRWTGLFAMLFYVSNWMHIHDVNATILHCLGIDHKKLSVKFQGLDVRLTGVEDNGPVKAILA